MHAEAEKKGVSYSALDTNVGDDTNTHSTDGYVRVAALEATNDE